MPTEDPAPSRPQPTLSEWLDQQFERARQQLLRAISATHLTKRRPQFGQVIVPVKGSIIAAPTVSESANPDYFFHWLRDSALAIDALVALVEHQADVPQATDQINDFVGFSLALNKLDGSALVRQGGWGRTNDQDLAVYVRNARALENLPSDAPFSEVRFNPDGTLDVLEWSRPQYDGPALRARALLKWLSAGALEREARDAAEDLLGADLDFTLRHYADPCFDIWEEQLGLHYYNRLLALNVLEQGVDWWTTKGDARKAEACRAAVRDIIAVLDDHWSDRLGYPVKCLDCVSERMPDELDAVVLLGIVHCGRTDGPHSLVDPRIHETLAKLEDLFASELPVNSGLAKQNAGPLLGRFKDDGYFGGGAFLMTTFAACEFYWLLSHLVAGGTNLAIATTNRRFLRRSGLALPASRVGTTTTDSERTVLAEGLRQRGDSIMHAVRACTPASGILPEQFDRETGAPASARNLTWSYAAFITAYYARRLGAKS